MASGMPSHRSMVIKVSIFAVAMLLVSAALVVVFGQFRFGPEASYHATFIDASRLKAGQKVRIAGVPVGSVQGIKLNRRQVRNRQALPAVLVHSRGGSLRKPGRRSVHGDHLRPR
jgi:ABC-type transporter Mla subunit MlaD